MENKDLLFQLSQLISQADSVIEDEMYWDKDGEWYTRKDFEDDLLKQSRGDENNTNNRMTYPQIAVQILELLSSLKKQSE